jgi:hypothetical protein
MANTSLAASVKERSSQKYDEIRENFALRFNKTARTEVKLLKLKKKILTSSVLEGNEVKYNRNMWISVPIWSS